jgi:hypothetical protein
MGQGPKKSFGWRKHLSFADSFLSLWGQLGISKLLATVFAFAGWMFFVIWAWLSQHIPSWGLGLLAIAAAVGVLALLFFVLGIVHRWQVIRSTHRLDPPDFERIGERMVNIANALMSLKAQRQREFEIIVGQRGNGGLGSVDYWEADRAFEVTTCAQMEQQFGAEAYGYLAFLGSIGVELPLHMDMRGSPHDNMLPRFLGMMGTLLRQNRIQEAIDASKDEAVVWRLVR